MHGRDEIVPNEERMVKEAVIGVVGVSVAKQEVQVEPLGPNTSR